MNCWSFWSLYVKECLNELLYLEEPPSGGSTATGETGSIMDELKNLDMFLEYG